MSCCVSIISLVQPSIGKRKGWGVVRLDALESVTEEVTHVEGLGMFCCKGKGGVCLG